MTEPLRTPGSSILTGRCVFVPNPCTTMPCLPGMAWAVETEKRLYYLTSGGHWSAEDSPWGGYTPRVGDHISVIGRVSSHQDARGESYWIVEVESVKPAAPEGAGP
jgi:hypothetical protein